MHTANATPSITRCHDYPDGRIVYAVPCLGGHDVNRHRSELLVEIMPTHGWLAEANTGECLVELGDTELIGWGDLDGPAVVVTIAGAGWQVAIPRTAYNALVQIQARKDH